MYGYKRLVLLVFVMTCVSVLVCGIAIGALYYAALRAQRARLTDTSHSQAQLMESIARFNRQYSNDFPGGSEAATLNQIEDAHRQYTGFGETGGFGFARRKGNDIVFLHSHRAGLERPKPVPIDSQLAEPMRRALRGERGTMIGTDYSGAKVLAAYEPIADLDMGIVAKIDLAEVRAPFVRSAMIASATGLVVVLIGSLVVFRLSEPMIHQLRESEAQLRRQLDDLMRAEYIRQRLSAIVESCDDAIIGKTLDGRIVTWSSGAERMYGYMADEMVDRSVSDLAPPDRSGEIVDILERLRNGESVDHFETERLRKDGRRIHVSLNVSPIKDGSGNIVGASTIARDISDRKQAEEALRREHELSDSIVNTAQNIVLVLDTQGRIVRFNPYMEELTGWRLGEVRGCDWFDTFLPARDRRRIRDLFVNATDGARVRGNTNPIVTKDGREREIEWNDAPLTDAEGRLIGVLCTGLDVTERRILEREVLEIAAAEQRRIGQELHDSTQQQLTGLGLLAESVAEALPRLSPADSGGGRLDRIEKLLQRATQIRDGLRQAANEVNQLARGLIPVEVDSQGLMAALTELARNVDESHLMACRFVCDAPIEVADRFTATYLYRIAQEAVSNALKHGGGNRLEVSLAQLDDQITLKVLDNGCGINQNCADGPGMGLRIMAYRADLIGATLSIDSPPGGGTEVACMISSGVPAEAHQV